MRLLLDTVTFVRAMISPDLISRRAMKALEDQKSVLEISSISISEIAIKQSKGKLLIDKIDTARGIADLRLRVLSFTGNHASKLFDLQPLHSDPFDRQIISQAMVEGIPIVTCDEKFKLYEGLKVIW